MRQESVLKSRLMVEFARIPESIGMRHEDVRTSGQPDISWTYSGMTSWIEVKHADPSCDSTGIQHLTMRRLARAGSAWYVIYRESDETKTTLIIRPRDFSVVAVRKGTVIVEATAPGHDHQFVVDFFRRLHESH